LSLFDRDVDETAKHGDSELTSDDYGTLARVVAL